MRIVIAPDKFKSCLDAPRVAQAMARGVLRARDNAQVVLVPMADGGEGTVRALICATNGHTRVVVVQGPLGKAVSAVYGILGGDRTAVVEMAAASGLDLITPEQRDPFRTSTYGTGQLILAAIAEDVGRVVVGIGGSATNDGGAGLAQALGYRLLDAAGKELIERGAGALAKLDRIDASMRNRMIDSVSIDVACDVDNPLIGPRGASAVFGPQKFDPSHPATPEQIEQLDANLAHFARIIQRDLGIPVADLPGAGAAGGLGAGLVAFAGGRLVPGVELVLDAVHLRDRLQGASLCLTGEGALDASSAGGKTAVGVARLAKSLGVPVIALAGSIGAGAEVVLNEGINAYLSICNSPMSLEQAMRDAEGLIEAATEQVVRVVCAGGGAR